MTEAAQDLTLAEDIPVPPHPAGSSALILMIERAATDPRVDIDKMERLLQMQERVFDRDAELAFNEAMKMAQEEMPTVVRDAANTQTNSRYARLETVSKAMGPVIARNGFSLSFGTDVSPLEGHYRVTCRVAHIGGHSRDYQADVPADGVGMKGNQNKTPTHAFGSTLSYGRRYLKMLVFDVSTSDDDDGGAGGGRGQSAASEAAITSINLCESVDELKAWKKKNADGLQAMPTDDADAIVRLWNSRLKTLTERAAS